MKHFIIVLIILLTTPFSGMASDIHLFQDPESGDIFMEKHGQKILVVPGPSPSPLPDIGDLTRPGGEFLPPSSLDRKVGEKIDLPFTWKGAGNLETETFEIPTSWRMLWRLSRSYPGQNPRLSILVLTEDGSFQDFPVQTEGIGEGVSPWLDAGLYSLSILSTGSWFVGISIELGEE